MGEGQEVENGPVVLLTALINTLQEDAGFHFIKVRSEEPAIGSVQGSFNECVATILLVDVCKFMYISVMGTHVYTTGLNPLNIK